MQDVFRAAVEVVEHVLERRQTRFVGLGLLGGKDLVERCAEHVDVGHDLAVAGIGENHQGDFVGDLRKTSRNIGMRAPGWHSIVINLTLVTIFDAPTLAGASQCGFDDFIIRPPVTHHLIQTIGGKVLNELIHLLKRDTISEQLARHVPHLKVGQRAVAVKGNKLGSKKAHECGP
ncbi:hypothetical protein D3C87_1414540 [compost metagenome]